MLHLLGKQGALTSALSPSSYQAYVLVCTLKFQGQLKPDQLLASLQLHSCYSWHWCQRRSRACFESKGVTATYTLQGARCTRECAVSQHCFPAVFHVASRAGVGTEYTAFSELSALLSLLGVFSSSQAHGCL